ncbi:MAG: transposase [Clostridium sp.]|jgi:predicted metal-dependent phosphoesterase TrpH|nr:transposase [Clostridium sp.]
MSFLLDTHVHTAESSHCARLPAAGVVEHYISLGYDGIVVTDHMKSEDWRLSMLPWHKKAERWLRGYRAACKAADGRLTVLLGMEIRPDDSHNDYLLFGVDEGFVYGTPNLHRVKNLKELRKIADRHGLLVVQAHPFRKGMTISDWTLLDGVEVLNGGAYHDSNNDVALQWAHKHSLLQTAGSDYHGYKSPKKTPAVHYGLRLREPVAESKRLAELLRAGEYELAAL